MEIKTLCSVGMMIVASMVLRAHATEMVEVAVDSERWQPAGGRVVDHLGRTALAGGATLADVEFLDGTIEVDVAVTRALFRADEFLGRV